MSKIVNLRQARKRRERGAQKADADANAALHWRTRAERAAQEAAGKKAESHLDGHKRDKP